MANIFVIRTFVHGGNGPGVLPPTICFERELALDMAAADRTEAEGVAVYELAADEQGAGAAKPFAAFGRIPEGFRRIGRDALLAAPVCEEAV